MAADAFDDLAAATAYMETNAKRVIREAAKLRTQVGALTGATVDADRRSLVRALNRGGVTGFVDAAGRNWRLSTYAEMVVRTKSAQAYNTGTVLRGVETGTNVYEISDGQRSEHAECLAYNRTTCSAGWALDHPIEHPNAVTAGTRVVPSGPVTAVYRIPWSGPQVTIRTARAGRLAVGPHHPMLTRRGWVPAGEVREGDKLVRRAGEMADPSRLGDLDDVPPTIEEMFHTVARGGVMLRVPASPDQFHGDGRWVDGDVDVVVVDGPLPRVRHLPLVEERGERRLDPVGSAVEAGRLPGTRAGLEGLDRVMGAAPGRVGRVDVGRIVPSPSERQAALAKAARDDLVGDAEVEANLSRRLALPVAFDEVVDVELETVGGHLYDLSTAGGVYLADDRIVSNCVRSFSPLPLHTGPVDHGDVDGPTVTDGTPPGDTYTPDEAAAIARLDGSNLTANGLDLSGLPTDRTFRINRGTAHDAEMGPSSCRVSSGRLHVVTDRAALTSPYVTADDALDAIVAKMGTATPRGLERAIRSVVYTEVRNPDDVIWTRRYGRPFTSNATSSGEGIVVWIRGSDNARDWLASSTIDHETGHSIMHLLNRKAAEAAEARRRAAAAGILDDAPDWLAADLRRLNLDPVDVPFDSLIQLGDSHRARLLTARRGEGLPTSGDWKVAKAIDNDLNDFALLREEVAAIGRDFTAHGATPGRGFYLGGLSDADRLVGIRRRYDRLVSEMDNARRDFQAGHFTLRSRPSVSPRVQREIRLRTFIPDEHGPGGHPISTFGYETFENQPARPGVSNYAASVDDAVEDWAETWRLWLLDNRHGRLGVDDYTGADVTFADLFPGRDRWIRDLFDLVGLDPSPSGPT